MNHGVTLFVKYLVYLILVIFIYQFLIFLYVSCRFVHKHFICSDNDLTSRYGIKSYVLITGASSGQGEFFAKELANRGFNLILIGSVRTKKTIDYIRSKYKNTDILFIEKDFRKAYQPFFFDDIEKQIENIEGNICGLVNNVAHRSGWNPFHTMPEQTINDTIIVGTIVQSRLTRMCIPYFIDRQSKNFIINITAQCIFPTFGFGEILENNITVPFLSVYEAANAFGFYQGNSVHKEYGKFTDKLDIMNVMPGAVITENTGFLSNTIFNIDANTFVNNIIRQLGTYDGNTYGHWGHEISILLVNIFPFLKNVILYNTGYNISKEYMSRPKKKY